MKQLKKIKLIHWHYFSNETINVEGNTLITGENGAGKSTILDAIQYVLSPGKQKFNVAANDGTKRTVTAYVRGKLGKSDRKYLREGDVTAHVALEFFDTLTNTPFIIGCVLDSRDPLSSPNQVFYDLSETKITDDLYLNDERVPYNISEFKKRHKNQKFQLATTMTQARKNIAARFNITDYNYFDLLPKALAFRPINNVKDFIYSYILEEKNIDVEYLVGNIKTYKEFIAILTDINEKLEMLDKIDESYKNVLSTEERMKIELYKHLRINLDYINSLMSNNESIITDLNSTLITLQDKATLIKTEMSEITSKKDDIHVSLLMNDDYKLLTRLTRDQEEQQLKLSDSKEKSQKIDELLNNEYKRAERLANIDNSLFIEQFLQFKGVELDIFNINDFVDAIQNYYMYILTERNSLQEKRTMEIVKKEILNEEMSSIYSDIKVLNEQKVLIPKDVVRFRDELKNKLQQNQEVTVEPVILSEVLEVLDSSWQKAIEGYLGRSRFNILVNPEYFQNALKIYEEIRHKYRSFPISIVNTNELYRYKDENPLGLSSQITSSYSYAKYYINYRLNNLIMCEKTEDLPNHKLAVTKNCILYSGYTVSELNPRNYQRLYIGSNAAQDQLKQAYDELNKKKRELQKHLDNINNYDEEIKGLDLYNITYIRDRIGIKTELFEKSRLLTDLNQTISDLQSDSFTDKKELIEGYEQEYSNLQNELSAINREIILTNHKLDNLESIEVLTERSKEERQKFEEFCVEIAYLLANAEKSYDELITEDVNYDALKQAIELELHKLEKDFLAKENDLILVMKEYNNKFSFDSEVGSQHVENYYSEKERLRTSHLIQYQEKVFESKQRSEKELQEHFVYRLQESLREASRHFADLNQSLSNIKFGNDEYRFLVQPNGRYKEYYDMLIDSVNYQTVEDGFSSEFLKKHGKTLNKLTDYMIQEELNEQFLNEIVDYRTYMDYDIEIIHSRDSRSLLSEISREKSGGETQIPYYVAMASTFIKIYQSHNEVSDSMGIVLFDEAFDKIDSTRTEAMMNFLSQLGLQVILSTPPQKVEDIYPFVQSTLVVSRENERSWVFTFNKEN